MFRLVFFFFKQKTAYEMRISDWSSDVCSSDLEIWVARCCAPSAKPACNLTADPTRQKLNGWRGSKKPRKQPGLRFSTNPAAEAVHRMRKIGRASCRERVCQYV